MDNMFGVAQKTDQLSGQALRKSCEGIGLEQKKRKTGKGRDGGGEKGERKRLFEEQLTSYIHLTENYEF